MPVSSDTAKCPLCERDAPYRRYKPNGYARGIDRYDCHNCGAFGILAEVKGELQANGDDRYKISALMREHALKKLPPILLVAEVPNEPFPENAEPYCLATTQEIISKWPKTTMERLDRVLCNLVNRYPYLGAGINVYKTEHALLFAQKDGEAFFALRYLRELHYLDGTPNAMGFAGHVTANGWHRFDELTRGGSSPENPVLVAMWFGGKEQVTRDEMAKVYGEGIAPAVQLAGYRVARVDQMEHNDDIMDMILGMIRMAPFVVADFTNHNNGVYYEAGFAHGLGIPVIHCCKEPDLKKAHFDTKQLNHVVWGDSSQLQKRLYNRIMGTIGPGPFFGNSRSPSS